METAVRRLLVALLALVLMAQAPAPEGRPIAGAALTAGYWGLMAQRCGLRSLDWAVSLTAKFQDDIHTLQPAPAGSLQRLFAGGQSQAEQAFLASRERACSAVPPDELKRLDGLSDGTTRFLQAP